MMSETIIYECELENGIHARPAGHIERLCNTFQSDIDWKNIRNGIQGDAKSVLSIVATDTLLNDVCEITISGEDAFSATQQLNELLKKLPSIEDSHSADVPAPIHYIPRSLREVQLDFIQGSSISSGTAIAKPVHAQSLSLSEMSTRNPNTTYSINQQKQMLTSGLMTLINEKNVALETSKGVEHDILQAHLSIITDTNFQSQISTAIAVGNNTWDAIIKTAMKFCEILNRSSSKYIKERTLDIIDITRQLLTTIYGAKTLPQINLNLKQPSIIIANTLTPSQFLGINKQYLSGLVLSDTGKTSHTAILARSLGIPTLTDIDISTLMLNTEKDIIIDGNLGILITSPSEKALHYYRNEMAVQQSMQQQMLASVRQSAATHDNHHIEIAANIASFAEAEVAFHSGAESIGLFRTEMSFMDRQAAPDYQELAELYSQVMQIADGKSVIFRTFDIGGDKPVGYLDIGEEDNPFLGYRAVRTYPRHRDLFTMQLKAILTASAYGNAKIMIPMIANVDEVIWCRSVLEEVKSAMRDEGLAFNEQISLGVMLEVPSVIFAITEIAEHVEFFSIGSNDLMQYFFAASRGNAQVESVYDSYTPAFLRAMKYIVDEVHQAGKWIGICGELGASKDFLPLFVGMGFDELSMSTTSIPNIKHALRELSFTKCQELVKNIATLKHSAEVKTTLRSSDVKAINTKPLLAPEFILYGLDASDKNDVIKRMVDNLWLHHRTDNRDQLVDDIWMREDSFSTAVGYGFAIPHTKSEHIQHSTISMVTLAKPIIWDDQEVTTVFMLTVRKSDNTNEHMKYFSTLARMLMKEDFRNQIKQANNATVLYKLMANTLGV